MKATAFAAASLASVAFAQSVRPLVQQRFEYANRPCVSAGPSSLTPADTASITCATSVALV